MKKIFSALLPMFLFGCATQSGIVSMGQEKFLIAKQQATGFSGLGNLKAEIISEASSHCQLKNKEIQILSSIESQPPYVFGNFPRAELTFTCVTQK